jgi:hypothetical protein
MYNAVVAQLLAVLEQWSEMSWVFGHTVELFPFPKGEA